MTYFLGCANDSRPPLDLFLHKITLMTTIATKVTAAITAITIHNVFSPSDNFFLLPPENTSLYIRYIMKEGRL